MKNKKTAIFVLVAIFILIPLGLTVFGYKIYVGTSREIEQTASYDRHYVMITGNEDSVLWDSVYDSALEEAEKRGIYVERFGKGLAVEYERNQLLKMAVQASVDGIIVVGDESEETVAYINDAVDHGIPVVTVFNDCSGSRRQCFVGSNNYHVGEEYGEQIKEILKANPKSYTRKVLVLMEENPKDASSNLILLGMRECLEEELGEPCAVAIETAQVDNSGSFSAEEYIRDLFLDEKQVPDILICLSDIYTQCAYQAAVDYNKVGDVQILGYYCSDQLLDALSKDIVKATITPDTEKMGRLCVQALDEYERTGYTNGYEAVDLRIVTSADAKKLLAERQKESEEDTEK